MQKIFLTLLITFTATSIYANQKPKSVDAANFDVAGVKLGMTYQQAEAAIKTKLVAKSDQFGINETANIISGEKTVEGFSVRDNNYFLTIHLTPSMQVTNQATYVVWSIEYMLPSGGLTETNKQAMITSALQKYGNSSNSEEKDWKIWCKTPAVGNIYMMQKSVVCDIKKEPVLEVSGGHITLKDFRAKAKLTKYLEQKKNITPSF